MRADSIELEWPDDHRLYLTIDYECDYGTALSENTYQALDHTAQLVDLLESLDISATCFVQTEVLEMKPEELERLKTADVDISFHPHSHTHKPRDETDITAEIRQSSEAYRNFFSRPPTGYRFPNGNIQSDDYRALSEQGYEFDASVFPSWRPNHFNNSQAPTRPQYFREYSLLELPFTVYSDRIRIPTALSYCQLIGTTYEWLLTTCPPDVIIFNIHMHDLVTPPSYDKLSPLYKLIYRRNPNGFPILRRLLESFKQAGYRFDTLTTVAEKCR